MAKDSTVNIYGELVIDTNKATAGTRKSLQSLTRNLKDFNKNPIISKNFTQPLGRITGAADEFTKSLEASNARVLAFGASAGAIFAVQKAMQELVKTTISVEQALTDINVLLNVSDKNFKRFSDGLFEVAKKTGTAFGEVAESANEFARQGLNVEDTLKRTSAALALSKLGMMDSVNATESLTAALNTFKGEVTDAEVVVNKLAQVDAKFAVSSKDLAEAIKRTGSSAKSAAVSFEELLAAVTVTQERTARGGAVIGNAFKTIFTRIQRPEVLDQLELVGVQVRKASGEVLPAINILKQYGKRFDSLTPAVQSNTSSLIAGGRQINILKALLPELAAGTGKFDEALRTANETTTEATDRLQILTSTTQGTLNAVKANLVKTASEIGSLTIKPAIDNILSILDSLVDNVSPSNFGPLGETVGKGIYEGIGKVLSGPGILLLATVLAKLGGNLLKFVSVSGSQFLGLNKAAESQANTQTIITNILAKRPEILELVLSKELSIAGAVELINTELRHSEGHYDNLIELAKKLASHQGMIGTGGGGKPPNASGLIPNFVPNFAMADAMAEREAASKGGYRAGQIRRRKIEGVGDVTYNGKEQVKQFPGMQQPAIMPPALSQAGRDYRGKFKDTLGFDPYNSGAAFGFVPNFAKGDNLGHIGQMEIFGSGDSKLIDAYNKALDNNDHSTRHALSAIRKSHPEQMAKLAPDAVQRRETTKQSDQIKAAVARGSVVDVDQQLGILSLLGDSNPNATTTTSLGQISAFNNILKDDILSDTEQTQLSKANVTFDNIQVSSLTSSGDDLGNTSKNHETFRNFQSSLRDNLPHLISDLAMASFNGVLGSKSITRSEMFEKIVAQKKSIIPESTEGELFETSARFATQNTKQIQKALAGGLNAPFDFEQGRTPDPRFAQAFFGGPNFSPSKIQRADAKRTADSKTIRSVINKSYNREVANMAQKAKSKVLADFNLPFLDGRPSAMDPSTGEMGPAYGGGAKLYDAIGENKKKAALGLVPNFSLKAISNAVKREDRSGVRRDKIRVGYDRRLAASGGIGVYNTDEGSLGNAINMHMAAGRNKSAIQTQGKAMGFTPNFAQSFMGGKVGLTKKEMADFKQGLRDLVSGKPVDTKPLHDLIQKSRDQGKASTTLTSALEKAATAGENASSRRVEAEKLAEKAIVKDTRVTKQNTKSRERGLAAMSALIVLGGQLDSWGEKLSESENGILSFAGEIASLGGKVAMWTPSIETAFKVLGVEGNNLGEQLGFLKAKFMTMIATTGGLNKALLGKHAQGKAGFLPGLLGEGGVRDSFRKGTRKSRRGRGGGIRGGLGSVASRGGLLGKAAGAARFALGPAGLAIGGAVAAYKILNASSEAAAKRFKKSSEKFNIHVLETQNKFEQLGKTLQSITQHTDAYIRALESGDKEEQDKQRALIEKDVKGGVVTGSLTQAEAAHLMKQINSGDINKIRSARDKIETSKTEGRDREAREERISKALQKLTEAPSQGMASTQLLELREAIQQSMIHDLSSKDAQIFSNRMEGASDLNVEDTIFGNQRGKIGKQGKSVKSAIQMILKNASTLDQANTAIDKLSSPNVLRKFYDSSNVMEKTQDVLGSLGDSSRKAMGELNKLNSTMAKQKNNAQQTINKAKQASEALRKMNDNLSKTAKFSKLASEISKIQADAEEKRKKIILDSNRKILSSLVSDFSKIGLTLQDKMSELQRGLIIKNQEASDNARGRQLDSLSSFSEGLETSLDKNEPEIKKAMQSIVEELRSASQRGATAGDLKKIVDQQRKSNPIFRPGVATDPNAPEALALTKLFTDLNRTISDNGFITISELRKIQTLNAEQLKTAKLQAERQLEELRMTQAIKFAGDGALNPEKFLLAISKSQSEQMVGRFVTRDRGAQTGALVAIVKQLKSLQISDSTGTIGNFSEGIISNIATEIETNLKQILRGLEIDPKSFDSVQLEGIKGRGLEAISRAKAEDITRPDLQKRQLTVLQDIEKKLEDVTDGKALNTKETNQLMLRAAEDGVKNEGGLIPREGTSAEKFEAARQSLKQTRGELDKMEPSEGRLTPEEIAIHKRTIEAHNELGNAVVAATKAYDSERRILKKPGGGFRSVKEVQRLSGKLDFENAGVALRGGKRELLARRQQLEAMGWKNAGLNKDFRDSGQSTDFAQKELARNKKLQDKDDASRRKLADKLESLQKEINELVKIIAREKTEQIKGGLSGLIKGLPGQMETVKTKLQKFYADLENKFEKNKVGKAMGAVTGPEYKGSFKEAIDAIITHELQKEGIMKERSLLTDSENKQELKPGDQKNIRGKLLVGELKEVSSQFAKSLKESGISIDNSTIIQTRVREQAAKLAKAFHEGTIGFGEFTFKLGSFMDSVLITLGHRRSGGRTPGNTADRMRKNQENAIAGGRGEDGPRDVSGDELMSPITGNRVTRQEYGAIAGELGMQQQDQLDTNIKLSSSSERMRNMTKDKGGLVSLFSDMGDLEGAKKHGGELRAFYSSIIADGIVTAEELDKFNAKLANKKTIAAQSGFDKNLIDQTTLQAEADKALAEASGDATEHTKALAKSLGTRFQYNAKTARKQFSGIALGMVDDLKGGLKGAFGEAIRGTATLREAFASMFDKIVDNMLDRSLDMGVDALFGAIGSGFTKTTTAAKGGRIRGYNSGGFVDQGSGVRDDVPAMMQGGEYVIRKSSVDKYGRGLFESLNSGGVVGYARGDRVMKNRARSEFLYNDPKKPTAGSWNTDSRLSAYAMMESGSPMIAIQKEREKTLEQYIKDKAAYDEMVQKAKDNFKKQQKARMKKTLISVGLQAATMGLMQYQGAPETPVGGFGEAYGANSIPGPYAAGKAPQFLQPHVPAPTALPWYAQKRAGGLIKAFARGGRNRDNIPAMLMGGEYVVNKQSVDKYGVGLFNGLNNGTARGFAEGGPVGESTGGGAPTTANNNFEINVNISGNGDAETTSSSDQNQEQSTDDQDRNEQLGEAVKGAVQTEIIEQQRPGGLLYREDRF